MLANIYLPYVPDRWFENRSARSCRGQAYLVRYADDFIAGKPAPSANVFVLKWRQVARVLDHERSYLENESAHPELRERTHTVEWLQFRLNEREDDIEILKPANGTKN